MASFGTASSIDVTAVAIHLLFERGYDATSVHELSEALEVSRSTFFRRFGTKEDIVFADHTILLERLADVLTTSEGDAFDAVNDACLTVLKYHLSRREATKERRALLRSNPSLRERELVMAHRYERLFRSHLSAEIVDPAPGWQPSAYAAAAVAVHNDALRRWFAETDRNPHDAAAGAISSLLRDLTALAYVFRASSQQTDPRRERVVVATFEADAPLDDVIARIRAVV